MTTATRTTFADLRWTVAPEPVIYLPARLHDWPLLESPDARVERIFRDRARLRRHELARFLSDLDQALAPRQGVPYEVALNPRYGRYSIRTLEGLAARSIFVIELDHRGLTFYPGPNQDPNTKFHNGAKWRKHYAAAPKRDQLLTLLQQRIARHNAKGGFYTN